jgi:AcrR family transcriptional regulator
MFIFLLTKGVCSLYDLNMFKNEIDTMHAASPSAGEKTKAVIFEKALELFRNRGFEVTTMRDIAHAAEMATGAAYYYFPSKEAIVSSYYDQVQRTHGEKAYEALRDKQGLRERLGVVLHSKLDILKEDRMFLGALFRYTGEPGHPLSVFGKGTQEQRKQSMEILKEALAGTEVSQEAAQILPWAIWLLHLAMILFFIYDDSEGQAKTHKLVDGVLDLFVGLVKVTSSAVVRPFVRPLQERLLEMMREAGLAGEN